MSGSTKVIFVSYFAPANDGHGGNHRTYQILHDCRRTFGDENVRALSFNGWEQEYLAGDGAGESRKRWWSLRFWRLAGLCRDSLVNPLRVAGSFRWAMSFHHPAFLAAYRAEVARMGSEIICVCEDTRFLTILQYNRRIGVPSLLAPQNIQSFHDVAWPAASTWRNRVRAGNFFQEFQAFSLADRVLLISRVEAGAVGGIGLPAAYYPYRPTGEIADYCDDIRARRRDLRAASAGEGVTDGKVSLLFVGSAGQPSTVASVEWLLHHVSREPLPGHIELRIAGGGTDRIAAGRKLPANVSVLGRVSDERLKELLIETRGVLIPAFQGMGALTRLSEINRCGVPMLVSNHVMNAINPLPGVIALEDSWPDWVAASKAIAGCPPVFEVGVNDEDASLESFRGWVQEAAGRP